MLPIKAFAALVAGIILCAGPADAWKRNEVAKEVVLGPKASVEEIQQTLDNFPERGGIVVLKPGTFIVNRPICLSKDNQTLRGAGPTTILRLADNANCPVLIMGSTSNYPDQVVRNLMVSDLDIDGNRTNQQVEYWNIDGEGSEIRNNGLVIRSVCDAIVERVRCYSCRSGGLVTEKGVRRLTVSRYSSWDNQYDGLAAYVTEDSLFTGLFLHHNPGAGLSFDHKFNRNTVSDSILTDNGCGIFMRDSRDNLFHGLTIRNSREHGVFMSQVATNTVPTPPVSADTVATPAVPKAVGRWIVIPNTECTGNVFSGMQITDSAAAGFLINDDNCANNVIQASHFARNKLGGLCESRPGLAKTQGNLER